MNSLSKREVEIVQLVSFGLSAKEISSELFLSRHTVISHKKNILSKLNCKNMASMVRKGFELGVLKPN